MRSYDEPSTAAAPFDLLIASKPARDGSSVMAGSAAVAAHVIAIAAVTLLGGAAPQPVPRDGLDTIMLELPSPTLSLPANTSGAGVARTSGDPGSHWIGSAALKTSEPPTLPPLDWAVPVAAVPSPSSDAVFTSDRITLAGMGGGADEAGTHEPGLEELAAAPTFTPFTRGTELENREEVRRWLLERYPPDLRDSRIGGRTTLWILVDDRGKARKAILLASSGYGSLDDAALQATDLMEFAPAWNSGHRVPVWVQLPVNFRVESP